MKTVLVLPVGRLSSLTFLQRELESELSAVGVKMFCVATTSSAHLIADASASLSPIVDLTTGTMYVMLEQERSWWDDFRGELQQQGWAEGLLPEWLVALFGEGKPPLFST